MGFVAGFIGGIALTTSITYLTLSLHERNRLHQSALLRQQSLVLRNIIDPLPQEPSHTTRSLIPGLADRLKFRWNTELEGVVKTVQAFKWDQWRKRMEERVGGAFAEGVGGAVDQAERKTS